MTEVFSANPPTSAPATFAPMTRSGCEVRRKLVAKITPAVGMAIFDRDALMQVLNNLVDNAEKFSRGAEDRRIHLTVDQSAQEVVLRVSDHGPGVEPGFQSKLFRPFVSANTSTKTAGLGLGLSVVSGLAAAHGGTVREACRAVGWVPLRARIVVESRVPR